jgi:hypothetical protein
MSGILDNKSRVLDNILTIEGRRQIATGKLVVEYVTFTDAAAFYKADIVSGSADATTRVYLESCALPQDHVTFQADDSGALKPFPIDSTYSLESGKLQKTIVTQLSSALYEGSSYSNTTAINDTFASMLDDVLASSLNNFQNQYPIATKDPIFEDDGFAVSPTTAEFVLTQNRPIQDPNCYVVNINHVESLFNDPRLANLKNFRFLPPIVRTDAVDVDKSDPTSVPKQLRLGTYAPWGKSNVSIDALRAQLNAELSTYANVGYMKTFTFDPTSRNNQIIAQVFEASNTSLKKLDVIDFGKMTVTSPETGKGVTQHVFFAGKIVIDDNQTQNFVHLFTLVFE